MILVCVDANALHRDPLLLKTFSERLLAHASAGTCEVHLSPVVLSELDRTLRDYVGGEHDAVQTRIKSVGDRCQLPVTEILEELDTLRTTVQQRVEARREELRNMPGVFVQPWPPKSVQQVVERELGRRRPFVDIEKMGTIGHRDTIIWLGVLQLAASRPNDDVIFVTKDKGFLDKDNLHHHLQEDLVEAGVALTRVKRMSDLYFVVTFLDKAAETDQRRATARAAIRQALHEYNEALAKDEQWGWEWDLRDGDLREPSFNAELPREMEEVNVINVETLLDITIRPDAPETGQTVECIHQLLISFSGLMTKSDWYTHDYLGLELWDPDHNDHYVSVEAHRVLELTTEVKYDPTTDEARVNALLRSRVIAHSY